MSNTNSLVHVPFNGQTIEAQKMGESYSAALKPLCENLGVDYSGQLQRLKKQPWATVGMTPTVGADGKIREMAMIDRKTFVMWLATIDTSRLKTNRAKEAVTAYQQEAAEALDQYFSTGIAINDHLLKAQHLRRLQNLELLKAAEGLVHPDFLEAKTRIVIAREMGEAPELDPLTRPLYVQDYLKEKNLGSRQAKSKGGVFGKRIKKAYQRKYGRDPQRNDMTLSSGRIVQTNAYTEADRPLFDQVWELINSQPQQMGLIA
jgi:hypothetical protein